MSDPKISPKEGLIRAADPQSGKKNEFILFSESWIELQAYNSAALELPITKGAFADKYGSFSQQSTIDECVTAMKGVSSAAAEFGNPKTFRKSLIENPNLLATKEPPTEIYAHTVWLGNKVHLTAQSLASGYESVVDNLPGLPPAEQVQNLKAYLFDATIGPILLGKTMSDETARLIKKLGIFEQRMSEYNEKLRAFTKASSGMIAMVNSTIGSIEQKIKELETTRDEAYKAWRDFTIAAVTTSVGAALIGGLLAPFTGGVSLLVGGAAAIALGVGLGVKAAENRAKYNAACSLISEETVNKQKAIRLRSDLGDFDVAMGRVGPAMNQFVRSLQTVQGVWVQMNTDMLAISEMVNESNVGSLPFLVKAKAKMAIDSWLAIDESAKVFTQESLIDYQSLAFGDPMPELPRANAA